MTADGPRDRRVLVVDDHAVVSVGLRALLGTQSWVARCVAAVDRQEALSLIQRYEPHIALVDLFVGPDSGVDICRAIKERAPEVSVVLMSGTGRVSPAVARAAGAVGFIAKTWSPPKLIAAVHAAASGRSVFATAAPPPPDGELSARQLDVLRQITRGASNPEAARALDLSPHTIKQHTSAIYRKLGVRNRAEAVRYAQSIGLVD